MTCRHVPDAADPSTLGFTQVFEEDHAVNLWQPANTGRWQDVIPRALLDSAATVNDAFFSTKRLLRSVVVPFVNPSSSLLVSLFSGNNYLMLTIPFLSPQERVQTNQFNELQCCCEEPFCNSGSYSLHDEDFMELEDESQCCCEELRCNPKSYSLPDGDFMGLEDESQCCCEEPCCNSGSYSLPDGNVITSENARTQPYQDPSPSAPDFNSFWSSIPVAVAADEQPYFNPDFDPFFCLTPQAFPVNEPSWYGLEANHMPLPSAPFFYAEPLDCWDRRPEGTPPYATVQGLPPAYAE